MEFISFSKTHTVSNLGLHDEANKTRSIGSRILKVTIVRGTANKMILEADSTSVTSLYQQLITIPRKDPFTSETKHPSFSLCSTYIIDRLYFPSHVSGDQTPKTKMLVARKRNMTITQKPLTNMGYYGSFYFRSYGYPFLENEKIPGQMILTTV